MQKLLVQSLSLFAISFALYTEAAVKTQFPESEYPVVGFLEKGDHIVTLKAGPKGSLYSIKTKSGKQLAKDVTAEGLARTAPQLHQFLQSAIASPGKFIDASLSPKFRSSSSSESAGREGQSGISWRIEEEQLP